MHIPHTILSRIIDVSKIIDQHPELLDFTKLSYYEKVELLKINVKTFFKLLDIENADAALKVEILATNKLRTIHTKVVIEENEIESLKNDIYSRLLKIDFKKYVRKERFLKLSKTEQATWFVEAPEWYVENVKEVPQLTSDKLYTLSARHPKFVDIYIKDFSNYCTNDTFWINMIRYDEKFGDIFLANTKTLVNQTEVRRVMYRYPLLVKKLDANIMADSKLTTKQWVLLVEQLKKSFKELKDWDFSDEVREAIKLDLTADMLTGKTKTSKRFTGVMKRILETEESNE